MSDRPVVYTPKRRRPPESRPIPEASLLHTLLHAAALLGYLAYHTYDSRHSHPGFPDLILVGHGMVCFWELKSATGYTTAPQRHWQAALQAVDDPHLDMRVIRPADLDAALRDLQGWKRETRHNGEL